MHIEYLDPRPFNASKPWNIPTLTGACNYDALFTTHLKTIADAYKIWPDFTSKKLEDCDVFENSNFHLPKF